MSSTIDNRAHIACKHGNIDLLKKLIDDGFNPNQLNSWSESPLTYAVKCGHLDCAELLINSGANVSNRDNADGVSFLAMAASSGFYHLFDLLIANGDSIHSVSQTHGSTPLHYAAANGKSATCQSLIGRGANINYSNNHGQTPLHWASKSYSQFPCAQLLISAGADPRVKDENKKSPIDISIKYGLLNSTTKLLDAVAASMNAKDAIEEILQFKNNFVIS